MRITLEIEGDESIDHTFYHGYDLDFLVTLPLLLQFIDVFPQIMGVVLINTGSLREGGTELTLRVVLEAQQSDQELILIMVDALLTPCLELPPSFLVLEHVAFHHQELPRISLHYADVTVANVATGCLLLHLREGRNAHLSTRTNALTLFLAHR